MSIPGSTVHNERFLEVKIELVVGSASNPMNYLIPRSQIVQLGCECCDPFSLFEFLSGFL
jgi:hypothetical protein